MEPRRTVLAFLLAAPVVAWMLVTAPAAAEDGDLPRLTFGSLVDASATGATQELTTLIEREVRELLRRDRQRSER